MTVQGRAASAACRGKIQCTDPGGEIHGERVAGRSAAQVSRRRVPPAALGKQCSRRPTFNVVQFLAQEFTCALGEADGRGKLPLHAAAWASTLEIIQWIAHEHPPALQVKTKVGKLPLHIAAEFCSFEKVEFLVRELPKAVDVATVGQHAEGALAWLGDIRGGVSARPPTHPF